MDKFSYSIGMVLAQNLKKQGIKNIIAIDLADAIADILSDSPTKIDGNEANQIIQAQLQDQAKSQFKEVLEAGEKFLTENAKREEVVSLPSGLQYQILKEGSGIRPQATDKVTTHYHGTLIDGRVFDSSVERGEPTSFPVNGVIPGWVEALQLMPLGSKWRLFIPHQLAYGDRGAGEVITPFATLIFEIELLKIN